MFFKCLLIGIGRDYKHFKIKTKWGINFLSIKITLMGVCLIDFTF